MIVAAPFASTLPSGSSISLAYRTARSGELVHLATGAIFQQRLLGRLLSLLPVFLDPVDMILQVFHTLHYIIRTVAFSGVRDGLDVASIGLVRSAS